MISSVKIIFNNITNPNHDCLPSCCCQLLPVHNLYILFQPCKGTLLTPPSYKNQHSLSTLPRLAFYDLLDNKMEAEAVQTSPLINQMTLRVYFCGEHQTSFTWLVEGSLNELFIVSKLKGLLERCFFFLQRYKWTISTPSALLMETSITCPLIFHSHTGAMNLRCNRYTDTQASCVITRGTMSAQLPVLLHSSGFQLT